MLHVAYQELILHLLVASLPLVVSSAEEVASSLYSASLDSTFEVAVVVKAGFVSPSSAF